MQIKERNKIYFNPSLKEALQIIKENLMKNLIIICGNCKINYEGRAKSELGLGERIILIKKDGCILIHRTTGVNPQNWQPPKCRFQLELNDSNLLIKTIRKTPKEVLKVTLTAINFLIIADLNDEAEFILNATEEDIKQAIILNPHLIEEGFQILSTERHVLPGFIDVYGVDKTGNHVIVELKRKTAGKNAVQQLYKYIRTLQLDKNVKIRGILAAPNITKEARILLERLRLEYKRINIKKCLEVLNKKSLKTGYLTDFIS